MLANCPRCGRLFTRSVQEICPSCAAEEAEDFKLVSRYLSEHPDLTIAELAEATGVSEERIVRFLREGRLVPSPTSKGIVLTCERCGKRIPSGHLCVECRAVLTGEITKQPRQRRPKLSEEPLTGRGRRMYAVDLWEREKKEKGSG